MTLGRAPSRSRCPSRAIEITLRLMAEARVPVIMDVDTGVDDCIALL
jgi:hypothetical protein